MNRFTPMMVTAALATGTQLAQCRQCSDRSRQDAHPLL